MQCGTSKRETYQALSSVFLDDVYTPYLRFQIFHHPGKKGQRVIHRPISRWSSRRVHLWSDIDSSQLSCFSTPSCLSKSGEWFYQFPIKQKIKRNAPHSINKSAFLLISWSCCIKSSKNIMFSGKKNTNWKCPPIHPIHQNTTQEVPAIQHSRQRRQGTMRVIRMIRSALRPETPAPHLPECNREKIVLFGSEFW